MRQYELDNFIESKKDLNYLIILLFKGDKCIPCGILLSKIKKILLRNKIIHKNSKLYVLTNEDEPTYHYEIKAVPTLIILNKSKIVYKYVGDQNETVLETKLLNLLNDEENAL